MTRIIKSADGKGFLAIVPVTGCANCPWCQTDCFCGHKDAPADSQLREYRHSEESMPYWCPALANAQGETADSVSWEDLHKKLDQIDEVFYRDVLSVFQLPEDMLGGQSGSYLDRNSQRGNHD